MNKLILSALLVSCLSAAWSCSKCFVGNCPYDDTKIIQFISKTDSTDVFASGMFNRDSLTITPLKLYAGGPAPTYEISTDPFFVVIDASENAAGFVFQLDSLPPDTLLTVVGYAKGDKCCDGVDTFEKVILNGDTLPQGRNDYNIVLFK